jgi:hypothetical protein
MIIATVSQSMPIFGFGALALVASAAPALWAVWIVRGKEWARIAAGVLTAGIAIAIVASEQPIWLALVAAVVAGAFAARRHLDRAGRWATAALVVAGGLPLYAVTLFLFAIAAAAVGCAPDAYECPI